MKKFLSLILAMAMIMSTLVVLTIMPAVAAEQTLLPAQTFTLDASNWLDENDCFTLATAQALYGAVFTINTSSAKALTYDGATDSLVAAEDPTATVFKVVDDKLISLVNRGASDAGYKPVIYFTAPAAGVYTFSADVELITLTGSAQFNGFVVAEEWDQFQANLTSNATTATATYANNPVTLTQGQVVAFGINETGGAAGDDAATEVALSINVEFTGNEGKAFNFKSIGTDDHGTGYTLYATNDNTLTNLKKLSVQGEGDARRKAGVWNKDSGSNYGYFADNEEDNLWAIQGDYNSVTTSKNVAIAFEVPSDGNYKVSSTVQAWGGNHKLQLYVNEAYYGVLEYAQNSDSVSKESGTITLKKGDILYGFVPTAGAGLNIMTYAVTYVGADTANIGYTASILPAEQATIGYETNVNVKLNVNKTEAATITNFASAEFKLTYDKTYFTFDVASSELGTAQYNIVEGENNINTLIVEDYGTTKAFGDAYTLAFKGIKATEGADPATVAITLTEAGFSRAVDAEKADLTPATLVNTVVNVQINKQRFDVTLTPADHFSTTGEAIIGESFTITEKNAANYDYNNVVITMGGVTLTEDDYTYSNNQYVIAEVTGAITVTADVTAKVYDVTINGDTESNDGTTATYNTDYSFTIPENVPVGDTTDGYTYTVYNLTIGGTAIIVDGVVQDGMAGRYSVAERTYTIGGSYITGAIAIEVKEEVTAANSVTVSYEGQTGAISTKPVQAVKNTAFSVTLDNPTPGYTYTVTYSVGGTDKGELTAVEGVYTIPAGDVTAPIVINVSATIKTNVSVEEYLTLNGATMYIVYNTVDELTNDTNYAIWGSTISGVKEMFWSDKYDAYCYLVVVEGEAPVASDFSLKIVNGAATAVHATEETDTVKYDVNLTGKVDINDAQLVYNMYETKAYTEFSANVTVEKFLRADINETVGITVEDASAIVTYILG